MDTTRFVIEHWSALAAVTSLLGAVALLWLATKFVSHRRCQEHREDMQAEQDALRAGQEALDPRLRSAETKVKTLPTAQDIADMKLSIERLTGRVRELEATVAGQRQLMERVERQLDRVDDYLRRSA